MSRERVALAWARSFSGSHEAGAPSGDDARARTLGRFLLRADQLDAVRRIVAAFEEYGGALLADPPGAGKTVVALAVARRAGRTMVVAPATLREQWERSARRAAVAITVVSMESLSRSSSRPKGQPALVIIDEAHHARTPTIRVYTRRV